MKSYRENPEGVENKNASKQAEREKFAAKMQAEEISCPNCYGGHFRPCQWCGDTGRVTNIPNAKPSNDELCSASDASASAIGYSAKSKKHE